MIYSDRTLSVLEYDKIRELLADCALTSGAKLRANNLTPSDDIDIVLKRQKMTGDAKRLLNVKGTPPLSMAKDVGDIAERAEKGAVLRPAELLDVASLLRTTRLLVDYISSNKTFDTVLDEIFDRLLPDRRLEDRIFRSVISEEMISDEASTELAEIRRKIRAAGNKIRELLQRYITGTTYTKYLQENIITTRNGRYVVPVRAECRNDIKGLVHDTSSSGATVFVEPMPVVEANNELKMLESREEKEIERILAVLSDEVAGVADRLRYNYDNITEIAFAFACAELSFRMDAISPSVSTDRSMELVRARHPLIDKSKVVPINVSVGKGYSTIVVTGPNTGGKTVTLKTVGLFALMAQSGLHIPADESSSVCIFDGVFADIGDEQSIEQSLSTFSAHMVNIVSIVDRITPGSLVLFDELGVGTDPTEGAALAVAVIEWVRAAGAICVATTHYAELKAYALNTDGVINASCEFNVETLKPTYKLIIGTPGRSNAFAITEKLGLRTEIIDNAKAMIASDDKRFEDVIEQLERTHTEMERQREEASRLKQEYESFKREAEAKIKSNTEKAIKELETAQKKAIAMVESARASSDFIFAQLEEIKKRKDSDNFGAELEAKRREVRNALRDIDNKVNPVEKKDDDKNYVLPRPLKKGDEVMIKGIGGRGYVLSVSSKGVSDKNGYAEVQAGILKTRVKISDLRLVENTPTVMSEGKKTQKASEYHVNASKDFHQEIDLRGMNGEEAWFAVDKYIDEAMFAGIHSVRLIHGKGTGALKNALWRFLKGDKRVASFRIGQYGEGDGGVTIVEIK